MQTPLDRLLEVYRQVSVTFGAADICFDDSPDVAGRVGAFVLLMNQMRSDEGGEMVRGVVVIAPPIVAKLDCDQSTIETAAIEATEKKFGRRLSEKELTALRNFVVVAHAPDLRSKSAIESLLEAPSQSAVIILYAALYRNEAAEKEVPSSLTLPEDVWVPHLCRLAEEVVRAAQSVECYTLIDVCEARPHRSDNRNRVNSIAECGVFAWDRRNDGAKLIADHLDDWQKLVKNGHVGSAFASIDALPAWMNSHKTFLKVQLVERILPGPHVLELIRENSKIIVESDPNSRLKLARIAWRSNDNKLAAELLSSCVPGLHSEENLTLAADLAVELGESELFDDVVGRSLSLFPESSALLDHKLKMYLWRRQYSELIALLSDPPADIGPERRFFYMTLAVRLKSDTTPDYKLILDAIASAAPAYDDWARIRCSKEASARHDYTTAIDLCLPTDSGSVTKGVANTLISAIKQRLLERTADGRSLVVSGDELVKPVLAAIRYISENPSDGGTRLQLTSLLAPETAGSLGFAILVVIANQLASSTQIRKRTKASPGQAEAASEEQLTEAARRIFEWAERESPVLPGFTKLPQDLLDLPIRDVYELAEHIVKSEHDLRQLEEAEVFDKWFMVAMLLAPHTHDPNEDLDLIRFAGARYSAVNKSQRARDFAEHALNITYGTPERTRVAWYAFADIYDRTKSFNEALLGISCALAVEVPVDVDQLYNEATLLIRIFRDINFTKYAMDLTQWVSEVCEAFELDERYILRLRTLELQLLVLDEHRLRGEGSGRIQQLTAMFGTHCRDLERAGEDLAPSTVFLAHCVQYCSRRGIPVDDDARKSLEQNLMRIPAATAAMVRVLNPASARGIDLLEVARSIEGARSAEDIAFDLVTLAIACRRFLDSQIDDDDVESAAFAIEALTDQALEPSLIGTNHSPFISIGRSLDMAKEVSGSGLNVVMLGLSESGRLVRLNLMNGNVTLVRESEETFSERKFAEWSDRYPYGYAKVQDPMNLFYMTLAGIGLSEPVTGPAVLIMDNSLQQMPPNLIMMRDDLAGRQTAMASAPSLSWLWAVQRRTQKIGKKVAWISTEFAEDRNPALITVAERLQETLDEYAIPLRTTAEVPDDLAESELLIVAAHGSLLPEGRYVQRISNDAELALYPGVLASAVSKSAVVILFICSGGRLDTHPSAETTIGLARQILDHGCSTVIAAPWPLDTRVPSHWLPVFLKAWTGGKTVIEATYEANQNVAKMMGDSPLDSLAMNVFGDPVRKFGKSCSLNL